MGGVSTLIEPVSGGHTCQSAVLTGEEGKLFAKVAPKDKLEMFVSETHSLATLAKVGAVRVPDFIEHGTFDQHAYLALEYIPMRPAGSREFHTLGEQLARLHLAPTKGRFGFERNNYIGATPQPNSWREDWASFFAEMRIGYQLELAADRGAAFEHGDQLVDRIPDLLGDHQPRPSLLHEDLWSGNVGFARDGTPVIFDPACYYGDREADIAFTEMFGGFPPEFYSGYRSIFPLEAGYEKRRDLYNLYHVLNHDNLFGGSYHQQAESTIRQLLIGF